MEGSEGGREGGRERAGHATVSRMCCFDDLLTSFCSRETLANSCLLACSRGCPGPAAGAVCMYEYSVVGGGGVSECRVCLTFLAPPPHCCAPP